MKFYKNRFRNLNSDLIFRKKMEESVDLRKVARDAVKEEEKEAKKKAKLDEKFGDGEEETVIFTLIFFSTLTQLKEQKSVLFEIWRNK